MIKKCKRCGQEKDHNEFGPKQTRQLKSGKTMVYKKSYCKECSGILSKQYKQETPHAWIATRYRISKEEALYWFNKTTSSCEICGKPWVEGTPKLCIDHNHTTGEIRGILCKACNHVLGHSYDSPDILESARFYLLQRGG